TAALGGRGCAGERGAGAGGVAAAGADEERGAACLEQVAYVVVMADVAELVREHAGDLVRIARRLQQPVEQVDPSARQRERVRRRGGEHLRVERDLDVARARELLHQRGEGGAAGGAFANAAAGPGAGPL